MFQGSRNFDCPVSSSIYASVETVTWIKVGRLLRS